MPNSTNRLARFVLGARFRGAEGVRVSRIVDAIECALIDVGGELPTDDRALLKLAVVAVAFYRLVGDVVRGDLELDVREEAILEAVLAKFGTEVS